VRSLGAIPNRSESLRKLIKKLGPAEKLRACYEAETISAVRDGKKLADRKQNALVTLVREIVRERGKAKTASIDEFLAAGYSKPQVMELLLGVALKTVSNYLDKLSPATVDAAFAAESR
jgi:hypothetical protein